MPSTCGGTKPCGSQAQADWITAASGGRIWQLGQMFGYSSSEMGYPSNMQPALAYAADALGETGSAAWTVFMNRSVKPNYGLGPQFAIVPR